MPRLCRGHIFLHLLFRDNPSGEPPVLFDGRFRFYRLAVKIHSSSIRMASFFSAGARKREHTAPRFRKPVFLETAVGFIGDGHLYYTKLQ